MIKLPRNSFNFSAQLIFNFEQITFVSISNEIDGHTQVTESPRPADSMQVSVCRGRKIEIDHDIDGRDVDSSCEQIRRYQYSSFAFPEIFEYYKIKKSKKLI
jgi:hypothetical protein